MRLFRITESWLYVLSLAVAFGTLSCHRFDPSDPPREPVFAAISILGCGGVAAGSQVAVEHPLFDGLDGLVAADGEVHLSWRPASDDQDAAGDLRYRVYLASGPGDQDFSTPDSETDFGETSTHVDGLANGTLVYAVVRSVDLDGNEDPNTVEWFATPNPVVYVNGSGTNEDVDGDSPQTAYHSVTQAIGNSIGDPDVNIFVAEGVYFENAFLFPGMFLYGGFDSSFAFDTHDPDEHPTQLSIQPSPFTVDVVTMVGEEDAMPMGIDGFQLDGGGSADNGIKIEDAHIRVSNCGIRAATAHGLEIVSTPGQGIFVEGLIRGCDIVENGAEGISINALADLAIDFNCIADNTNEGIESQWLLAAADRDTRIDIRRNRIERNGDEGIDLDVAELSELDPAASAGARVRILIRNNIIRNNLSSGIQIDVDYEESDGVDARCRIEDNEVVANAWHGIAIDADAHASFRLARNVLNANRQWGVLVKGSAQGPVTRVLNCRIMANGFGGVTASGYGIVDVRNCVVRGHTTAPAFEAVDAQLRVRNSIVIDNGSESTVHAVDFSIADSGEFADSAVGSGVFEDDAGFENHPVAIAATSAAGSGSRIPLAVASDWSVGDVLELDDDGVPRTVTAVDGSGVFVDPAPARVSAGQAVFRFPGGSDVFENERPQTGSAAVDAGDPEEEDRDGTRADLGPQGGDTPGNVGIETGLATRSASLEIVRVTPPGGLPHVMSRTIDLVLNRELATEVADAVRIWIGGAEVTPDITVVGRSLRVKLFGLVDAGDTIEMELGSFEGADQESSSKSRWQLEALAAAAVTESENNDSELTAQSIGEPTVVRGVIASASDQDFFQIDLAADELLAVSLVAGQLESPLVSRVVILDGTGAMLAESASAPPIDLDPHPIQYQARVEETVYVSVESVDGLGSVDHSYQLHLLPRVAE